MCFIREFALPERTVRRRWASAGVARTSPFPKNVGKVNNIFLPIKRRPLSVHPVQRKKTESVSEKMAPPCRIVSAFAKATADGKHAAANEERDCEQGLYPPGRLWHKCNRVIGTSNEGSAPAPVYPAEDAVKTFGNGLPVLTKNAETCRAYLGTTLVTGVCHSTSLRARKRRSAARPLQHGRTAAVFSRYFTL